MVQIQYLATRVLMTDYSISSIIIKCIHENIIKIRIDTVGYSGNFAADRRRVEIINNCAARSVGWIA